MAETTEHQAVPDPATLRDFAGMWRNREAAFDYPMTASCLACQQPVAKPGPGCAWTHDADTEATPEQPAERVTTVYIVPGTAPALAIGITDRAGVVFGEQTGGGPAGGINWVSRADRAGLSALQAVIDQVLAEQKQVAEQLYPPPLDVRIARVLRGRPDFGYTAHELAVTLAEPRSQVDAELAAMLHASRVAIVPGTFRSRDRQPRYILKTG
jgi:hypothetical protein